MNKFKLAAGVILLLIVGVLAGSLGTGIYYKKRVERFESGGLPVSERVRIVLGRFSDDLELTDEQRVEFEKILRESQENIFAIGRKTFPEIEKVNEQTFASIKEKLTDEQKSKLDELIQRMKDVRNRFPGGQFHPQRTPDQSRPQGSQDQVPPQTGSEQASRQRTPDAVFPNGTPVLKTIQENNMHFVEALKDHLNLSQEQEAKVRSIVEESAKEREKVLEKFRGDLIEIENSLEKGLSSILTKEQMEKYRTAKEKWSFEMPRHEGPF